MGGYLFLISVVLAPVMCACLVADKRDRFLLAALVCLAGIVCLLVLSILNDVFPFAGGGDDENYFDASKRTFTGLREWFDTAQFEHHEQVGYPLLLAWVHQISGDSLFQLKALNVFFMLQISLVWFVIGEVIGGRRLAFIYACGVLLATPLWYYWLFLLKDMAITLLQSIFLLGLIVFNAGEHRLRGYAVIVLSTLAMIPFRNLLAVFNAVFLVACMFLLGRAGATRVGFGRWLAMVGSLVLGLWLLSSQPEIMESLGATGEDRLLSASGVEAQTERLEIEREALGQNPLKFPVLYLVGETDALNPSNWGQFELENLRSLSMVPWIFLGLPFFLAGAAMLLRRRVRKGLAVRMEDFDDRRRTGEWDRRQSSALLVLLAFVVAYAGLGWFSGSTTRWTLPSIPPMIGIAGFAWVSMNRYARFRLITGSSFALVGFIFIYYVLLR